MDADNRALCKLLRDQGHSWREICGAVVKTDNGNPDFKAVQRVVKQWGTARKPAGRPKGSQATTADQDVMIVDTMIKIRGPNSGGLVPLEDIRKNLPEEIQWVSTELIRRRLKAAGYSHEAKMEKDHPALKDR